jgi:two-component system, sensor histidine kinase
LSASAIDVGALVDALSLPAVLVGADDGLLALNDAARRLFTEGSRLPGRHFRDLAVLYEIPGLRPALEDVKVGATSRVVSGIVRNADRHHVPLDVALTPVTGPDGVVSAVLLTVTDRSDHSALVTELELLSAEHAEMLAREDENTARLESLNGELEVANTELEVANEDLREQVRKLAAAEAADIRKNQFLAMLAHELRNPLGGAVNALHVIQQIAGQNRRIQQAVRIAQRQLRHEARLLDDLLDVSRIILGKIAVESEPLDLRASVRAAVEGAEHAARARALDLRVTVPDEPLVITGDATRLEQCLGNLLSNAVKFTPPGGTVAIQAARRDADAVITVRDSGVGIPGEMLGRVFDLFVQAGPALARGQGGLGIGLTLVRHLVDLQGGSVVARSPGPGRGSEFEIRLPLSGTLAAPPPEVELVVRPRRILLVEDNRDAREMLRVMLEMAGHAVLETGDGVAAIQMASESAPDVVLLDIGLPDVDGFEVARRIRARLGASVRLIGLSGYGDSEARRAGQEAGFDVHLVKPVPPDVLLRSLDEP